MVTMATMATAKAHETLAIGQMRDAILQGDALAVLRTLPSESVQTCMSSPPYWSLRSYATEPQVWQPDDADPGCRHVWCDPVRAPWANELAGPNGRRKNTLGSRSRSSEAGMFCQRCEAWRGELGGEPSIALYVAHIVSVFREVRRVLHPSGTLWINIGDSYADSGKASGGTPSAFGKQRALADQPRTSSTPVTDGLRNKSLCMIPARVAIALQDEGWLLRSEIVWSKVSPLPESVRDRPTRSHEMVYLLSKQATYYYDADAIAEPVAYGSGGSLFTVGKTAAAHPDTSQKPRIERATRNCRDVWTIRSEGFRGGAHFAVMPAKLAERCLLAGSRPGDLVLDPFGGSGTVGRVAQQYGRHYFLIELNPQYVQMAEKRCAQDNLWLSAQQTETAETAGEREGVSA